jgi:hypothetical protein
VDYWDRPDGDFGPLALIALRCGVGREDAWFLIAEAARHGHGDAQALLPAYASPAATLADSPSRHIEDPLALREIRTQLLRLPSRADAAPSPTAPDPPDASPGPRAGNCRHNGLLHRPSSSSGEGTHADTH